MRVQFRVRLFSPLTGRQIADLVKSVAGEQYVQSRVMVDDDGEGYAIGCSSGYPYEDVVVTSDPNKSTDIRLDQVYEQLYVKSFAFGGGKYAIAYTDDQIVHAVREFRDQLQQKLDASLNSDSD